MCQCFEGDKVDWENLRTPEQQAVMQLLSGPMLSGLQMGATPFSGQMSAPMSGAQKMAMTTMADIGGYGWKPQKAKYKSVPKVDVPSLDFLGGGGNGNTVAKTSDELNTQITSGEKKASDQSADVSLNEDLIPYLLNALSQMQSMGGQFNYDPNNPRV